MELRGYEFNQLRSFGTLEQLKTAQQSLKRGIAGNAFALVLSVAAGAGIAYAGGSLMVNIEKDSNGKGSGIVTMLGLVGVFGGLAIGAGGTVLAATGIERKANDIEKLGYVISDRTPRND